MAVRNRKDFYQFDSEYLKDLNLADAATEQHFISYFTPMVEGKLRRLCSREDVGDAKQETFIRVLAAVRTRNNVRHAAGFGAFVHAVCRNVAMEMGRKESRYQPLDDAILCRPEARNSPQTAAEAAETGAQVRRTLAALPEFDRQLLQEAFLQEEDRTVIGRRLGVSSAHLRVLLHRAKRRFLAHHLTKAKENPASVTGAAGEMRLMV